MTSLLTFILFISILHWSIHEEVMQQHSLSYNTSLIHNITRVLDTILLNQDRHFRPLNGDPHAPLQVEIDISVRSIGPISEQQMEFSLDCYFRQKWLDHRLAFDMFGNREHLPIASKMLKDIWTPDTYIRNGRNSYLHTLTVPNVLFRVRYDGQVHVSQRAILVGKIDNFALEALTFNDFENALFYLFYYISLIVCYIGAMLQACPIEIGSLGYFTKDIVYVWKDVELDSKMSNMLAQYQLLHVIKTSNNFTDLHDRNLKVSVLKVYFKLQRQQGFYILQIYTPCTLIVVMSWVSFWINKESSPARVSLGIMTILSVSTLGFGYRSDLPKVSHSTALDIYIISCFGFVFAAMIEYAIINYANRIHIRKKISKMRTLSTSLVVPRRKGNTHHEILAPYSKSQRLSRGLFATREQHSVLHRIAARAKERLQIKNPANAVSRIDSASKIVFPSLYILFNIIYWLAFLYWIPDEINSFI